MYPPLRRHSGFGPGGSAPCTLEEEVTQGLGLPRSLRDPTAPCRRVRVEEHGEGGAVRGLHQKGQWYHPPRDHRPKCQPGEEGQHAGQQPRAHTRPVTWVPHSWRTPASSVPVAHLWAHAVGDQFHKSSREHLARQQTHGWHFRKPRLARF